MDKSLELYQQVYEMGGEFAGMAAYKIAELYEKEGKDEDAFKWYKESADKGYDQAMIRMGLYCIDGKIFLKNERNAMAWFRKAYEQKAEVVGFAAQQIGSIYYFSGYYKEAFDWYQKGALLGDGEAMCALGDCYLMGEGGEKDLEKAQKCYQMAYEKQGAGAERAAEALRRIYRVKGGTEEKEQFLNDLELENEIGHVDNRE